MNNPYLEKMRRKQRRKEQIARKKEDKKNSKRPPRLRKPGRPKPRSTQLHVS